MCYLGRQSVGSGGATGTQALVMHCLSICLSVGADGAWIELTYPGGDKYGSHCQKTSRTARIVFLCDPNIPGMVSENLHTLRSTLNW